MEKVVLGIVDSPGQAEVVAQRLVALGFAPGDVSMLFPDKRGSHDFAFEHHTHAPESALGGAGLGALIGGVLGIALGMGVVRVPGLEALVAAGPVVAALAVAAVFALAFGVIGALLGLASPKIQAKHYAGKVRNGSILVAVHVTKRADLHRARDVLRSAAADNVTVTGEASVPASARA